MKSTFATELFVKLFGVMPPDGKKKSDKKTPKTEVMIPNRPADSGDKVIYHVTPRRKDDRWNVKKEGGSRPSAVCDTKEEAINRAREIAHNLPWSQVIIHNKDGKIAHEYNYGGPPGERASSASGGRNKAVAVDDEDEQPDETESDDGFIDDYEGEEVEDESGFKPLAGERVIYHVTPRKKDGRWNVRRRGAERPSRVVENKEPAIEQAKEFAKNHTWSQVIIHNTDGKIANEYAYGGPAEESPTKRPTSKVQKKAAPSRRTQKVKEEASAGRSTTKRLVWHVTPRAEDGKWRVKRQGSTRPTRILDKKDDAIGVAKELAQNAKSGQVVVHNQNGKISFEHKYDGGGSADRRPSATGEKPETKPRIVYHVTPRAEDGQWNVMKEGGEKPSGVYETKDKAVERARELAKNQPQAQILIHNKDGKISHGHNYDA